MSQPKFYIGQPVTVKPVGNTTPAFDAVIESFYEACGELCDGITYFGYGYKTTPHNIGPDRYWAEKVIFPRNPDNKGNGMVWEDIKKSLSNDVPLVNPSSPEKLGR